MGKKRLQKHTPSPRRSSSMDGCVDDMPTNDADFVTAILKSGKWVAKIRHPIKKVWVCVGIYSNREEAADACARKKVEYESHSVQETDASFHTNVEDFEKHTGVKHSASSGKWLASIKHQGVKVWLGSYNTPNEAVDAFNLSKLELQSPKVGSLRKVGGSVDLDPRCELGLKNQDAQEAVSRKKCELVSNGDAEQSERNQRWRHAYVRKSGRWQTDIMHPMKKGKNIYLGTFDTAEEAEDAYNSTKRQFELMFPGYVDSKQSNKSVHLGTLTDEACNNKMREVNLIARAHKKPRQSKGSCKADVSVDLDPRCELGLKTQDAQEAVSRKKCELVSNGDAEQSERNQRRRHAYVRKSGRWQTEIRHPMKKSNKIYLGTFDTAEEAEEAYNSTKRQFELMFPGYMNCKQSKESVYLGTLTEETGKAYNNKMRKVDLIVRAHKKPKQSKGFGSSSLKDGIMQAVSSPFAAAHKREVGSVYKDKLGKWKAEIQIRKVRHKLGTFATAEDAREALNQKKCELGLKGEDAEEALNRKKCELGLNGDAEQSERNQRQRHAYVHKSGRWRAEIRHPIIKAKKICLGTFDTAEEAEDAYKSMRRRFELMSPGYMNCKQSNESVQLGTLSEEAEEAYDNKMGEVDLMVSAHKKPKQLMGYCKADLIAEGKFDDPLVCTNGCSVIKGSREEFDLGVIDSCGQLVGEYSKMDDELWIS